jgi:hypothetical protein
MSGSGHFVETDEEIASTAGVTRETIKRDLKGTNVPFTDAVITNSRDSGERSWNAKQNP